MFPTGSSRTLQPAASPHCVSSLRPAMSASVKACRLQPPLDVAPIWAISINRDQSRSPCTFGIFILAFSIQLTHSYPDTLRLNDCSRLVAFERVMELQTRGSRPTDEVRPVVIRT